MIPQPIPRRSGNDDGIAMVLSLLFMLLLSALGTAMLVSSRSETLSSVNYRMMSQARYGAESGVHKAAHFLLNSYTLPGSVSDPLSNYNYAQSPVSYLGAPVVLSALSGVTSNYPISATQTAFSAAAQGSLPVGDATVTYTASATLLSMRDVLPYGGASWTVVQTWRLTARGTIQGARTAEVEVSAVIERQVMPVHMYALFALKNGCGALAFGGDMRTDSYDSSNMTLVGGVPQTDNYGGNVGTNGNLAEGGSETIVYGSLSTPRSGVGTCKEGAVTAISQKSGAQVTEGFIKLPQKVEWANPDLPSPMPPVTETTIQGGTTCAQVPITSGSCTITYPIMGVGSITLTPTTGTPMGLGNIQVTSGATLVLNAGTYDINSLKLNGGATVKIATGPVILNVAGVAQETPIDFEGGSISNATFDPSLFRILYAGTAELNVQGSTRTAAVVYAPNAHVSITGTSHYYGSVLAREIAVGGGSQVHYDRRLGRDFLGLGPRMMSVFTWKEY